MNRARTAAPQFELPPTAVSSAGEYFVPPRAAYTTYIPAILILTGLPAWIAGNDLAMALAAAVGGVTALYMLWDWLFEEGPTRISTVMAMTLLLGYGLGALNTWLTLPRGGLTVAQFLGGDESVYAHGMAAVLLVTGPLCFVGEFFERPLFGSEFRLPLDYRTYAFIVLGTGAVVAGFLTHNLEFQGLQMKAGQQLSPAASLLSSAFPPLTALAVAVCLVARGRVIKPLIILCTFILCILIMAVGRRSMIYTAMLVIFALRLTGFKIRRAFLKKILLMAGLGFFLAVGVSVFMLLRLAGFQTGKGLNTTLAERIQIALTWVEDGTALNRATEANRVNFQGRTFVLGFFADVLDGSMRRTPALGKLAMGFASQAIPRVFNPNKDLTFGEEPLVDAQFGLTYADAANSILSNGATDFGIFGILLYPLLLVFVLRVLMTGFAMVLPPMPLAFIALALLFTVLQTETTLVSYFALIRDVLIYGSILYIFARLPRLSLRNQ